MFSDLPKLFDRNFFVGFLLPILGFFLVTIPSLIILPGAKLFIDFLKANSAIGASIIAIFAWLAAMLLLVLNRSIVRAKEGYGRFNPAKLWAPLERARFKRLYSKIDAVEKAYEEAQVDGKQFPPNLALRRRRLARQRAERFPETQDLLLPTAFGNVVRSFEVYPRVMYGLDGVSGWDRLIAVMPKDYREVVDSAKVQVDFWVNTWILAVAFVVEHIVLDFNLRQGGIAILLGALGAWLASRRAREAACDWGATVRSAFDVYLPALREALRLPVPLNRGDERRIWTTFSQAVTYRSVESLPDLPSVKES